LSPLTRLLARARRLRAGGDAGFGLVTVMGAALTMTLLVVGLSGYVLSGYVSAKRNADWTSAIAAAQAGVDDYIARLNDDELYWTRPDPANPAFAGWTPLPGATNGAAFRYTVDTAVTQGTGLVKLTASGKVDDEVRTVSATLRRGRFFDFVYFSDFETGDPANPLFYSTSYWRSRDPEAVCGQYNWAAGWNSRNSECPKIYWRNDEVVGRFHTNDQFFVNGSPKFNGTVTSGCPVVGANAACNRRTVWVPYDGATSPRFSSQPVGGIMLPLPASNAGIRREADPALGGRGCMFTGPTRIVFKNGRMAVHSPNTKYDTPCTTAARNGSGTSATDAVLPPNGVIYVRNVPSGQSGVDCSRPWLSTPGSLPDNRSGGSSYPLSNDRTSYDCRSGDTFVEGTLSGQVTIAAENNIVLTGNLRYTNGNSGTDVLGLVAENNVTIYHPVKSDGDDILTGQQMRDVEVWAATLSVRHSFNVQNYNAGTPRGTLTVRGSIAQKWRGAIGQSSGSTTVNGYLKDWAYDDRLAWLSPPKFLDPVAASWLPIEQAETTPAYTP
jgi:hypothetical protein